MKVLKIPLIILILLLLLYWITLWTAGIWVNHKLSDSFAQSAMSSRYTLDVKRISIHPLIRTIRLHKLTLIPLNADSLIKVEKSLAELHILKISLEGIDVRKFIETKQIQLERLHLQSPNFALTTDNTSKEKKTKTGQEIPAFFNGFYLGHLEISAGFFSLKNAGQKHSLIEIPLIDLSLEDISLVSDSLNHKQAFNISMASDLELKSFSFRIPKSYYRLGAAAVSLNKDSGELLFEELSLKPFRGLYEQATGLNLQDDVVEITIGRVQTKGFSSKALLSDKSLHLEGLFLDNPSIALLRDKRLPDDLLKRPKMPQALFKLHTQKFAIDSIHLINGNLSYTELIGKEALEATIRFDSLQALITGLSGVPSPKSGRNLIASASAKLMSKGSVKTRIIWHESLRDSFSFEGSLGPMKINHINNMIKNATGAMFRSGTIDSILFHGAGNKYGAKGLFEMRYQNLDMALTKKRSEEPNKFLSKLLNMIIKSDNPSEDEGVRRVSMQADRVPYKGFFNLYWKTLEDGLINTVKPGKKKNKDTNRSLKEEWEKLKQTLKSD
ncbi:MAG: hypothetical protein PF694_01770 [Bacteroidetes bacterium]|jgi:hypothetical protein|nr:hypothetical protein [Bacteroidota bacterium]